MFKYIKGFFKYRFLLKELVIKGIRLKYRRSYLGIIWSLIEPILTTIVMVVVFGTLFDNKNPQFPVYVVCGRLIYSFFSSSTKHATKAIRDNASMIRKVYVPKYLYPLSSVLFHFVIFIISLLAILPVMLYTRTWPSLYIWQCFPALALLIVLTTGVSMFLSAMHVFFRDVEYLWNVLLLLIMYVSAIFYYPTRLEKSHYDWILHYNPLYLIIDMFRGGILGYQVQLWNYSFTFCVGVALLFFGTYIFWKKQDEFILHI